VQCTIGKEKEKKLYHKLGENVLLKQKSKVPVVP
jgi:hypothetical protein